MDALFQGRELVLEPLRHHLEPEMQEVPEDRLQIQPLGAADLRILGRDETGQVHREVDLQRRVLEEVRHDHLLVGVLLQLDRDPHIVCRQIADVEERWELAAEGHVRDPLHERRLVGGVGDARDVDGLRAASFRAHLPGGAQANRAGAGLVNLLQLLG